MLSFSARQTARRPSSMWARAVRGGIFLAEPFFAAAPFHMPPFFHGPRARRARNERPRRRGFTLIELLTVIAIIGILSGLVFTGARKAIVAAKRSNSASNLRAIGQGMALFLADNNNTYFGAGPGSGASGATYDARGYYRWPQRVGPYMGLSGPVIALQTTDGDNVRVLSNAYRHAVFHTPFTDPDHWREGNGTGLNSTMGVYGINTKIIVGANSTGLNIWGIKADEIRNPARTIFMAEHYAGGDYQGTSETTAGVELHRSGPYPTYTNGMASNEEDNLKGSTCILFADGHVDTVPIAELDPWPDTGTSTSARMTFLP